jgi:hypothetical protein
VPGFSKALTEFDAFIRMIRCSKSFRFRFRFRASRRCDCCVVSSSGCSIMREMHGRLRLFNPYSATARRPESWTSKHNYSSVSPKWCDSSKSCAVASTFTAS